MFTGRGFRRHKVDNSTDSRMSALAQVYRLDTRKLDIGIKRTDWLGEVELGAARVDSSETMARHAPDQRKSRVLCSLHAIHPERRFPEHWFCFVHHRTGTNAPEFSPADAQAPIAVTLRIRQWDRSARGVGPQLDTSLDTSLIDRHPSLPPIPVSQDSYGPEASQPQVHPPP